MKTWKWLYHPGQPFNWRFVRNVLIKTALLFALANVIFALLNPLEALGHLSIYNVLVPGRERLPYGDNPAAARNLSLDNVPAMFAAHEVSAADDDEFRVILIGDSSIWGVLLRPEETLAGQLNAAGLQVDGRPVKVYNLGYPTMSLTKDLMLLDYAMRYDPHLIIWSFTLQSFDQQAQLESAIVRNNPDRVRDLIRDYDLLQDVDDARFSESSLWEQTIIGQRRALADWLRLQLYAVAWAISEIDQEYPTDYAPRSIDLLDDDIWRGFRPRTFAPEDLAFDVLRAGLARAGDTPVLLINEPIFISQGENSDVRYNAFYPIWAYDDYLRLLDEQTDANGWDLLNTWDRLPDAACYTDSPVHLTPTCSAQLSEWVAEALLNLAETGQLSEPAE